MTVWGGVPIWMGHSHSRSSCSPKPLMRAAAEQCQPNPKVPSRIHGIPDRIPTGIMVIEKVLGGIRIGQMSKLGHSLGLCSNTIGRVLVVVNGVDNDTMTRHQRRIVAENGGDQEADAQPEGHARHAGNWDLHGGFWCRAWFWFRWRMQLRMPERL